MNSVNIIGRLAQDPVVRVAGTDSNGAERHVAHFAIAVSDGYGDSAKTYFFDVSAFGRTGDSVAHYCKKGRLVAVTGKLTQYKFEKNGEPREKVSIEATNVDFLDSKGQDSQPAPRASKKQEADAILFGDGPLDVADDLSLADDYEDGIPF